MNFYCARCDSALPYSVGLCPSCGQVFPSNVPSYDAPGYTELGVQTWPVTPPTLLDKFVARWDFIGDVISPPLFLSLLAGGLAGTLAVAQWFLRGQYHHLRDAHASVGEAAGAVPQGVAHAALVFGLLVMLAAAVAALIALRRWRLQDTTRRSRAQRAGSLAAREGLAFVALAGLFLWYTGAVRQASSAPAPAASPAPTTPSPTLPSPTTSAEMTAQADFQQAEAAYKDGMTHLRQHGIGGAAATINQDLKTIRKAQEAITQDAAQHTGARDADRQYLKQLALDSQRLKSAVVP